MAIPIFAQSGKPHNYSLGRGQPLSKWKTTGRADQGKACHSLSMKIVYRLFLLAVVCVVLGCRRSGQLAGPGPRQTAYEVKGVVREVNPAESSLTIEHEDIPGFMPAMTMSFAVKDPTLIQKLVADDRVRFQLAVTETDSWIVSIAKIPGLIEPSTASARPSEGPALEPGQVVPNFAVIDQDGRTIQLQDYRGQAVVVTFIFTRCPLPNYCPLMSRNFSVLQKELRQQFPEKVHLLSISFDPAHDTTAVRKEYAENYGADPKDWSFATGTPSQIKSVATLFGLTYEMQGVSITHNLRTALIGPNGRLVHVWKSNTWQPREVTNMIQGIQPIPSGG